MLDFGTSVRNIAMVTSYSFVLSRRLEHKHRRWADRKTVRSMIAARGDERDEPHGLSAFPFGLHICIDAGARRRCFDGGPTSRSIQGRREEIAAARRPRRQVRRPRAVDE